MGTGLYPQFVSGLMCQVGVSKFVDCCRVAGWWTPIFFYVFCFVRLPIVDGTGVFGVVVRKVCLPDCGWDRYV